MDYYSTDKIIEWAKCHKGALAPIERQEWVKLCWCLQYLRYPASTFTAVSRTDTSETECNRVWKREQTRYRTYIKSNDQAVSAIVGMAKAATRAAGVGMEMFRNNNHYLVAPIQRTKPAAQVTPTEPDEQKEQPKVVSYVSDKELAKMELNMRKSNLFVYLCSIFPEEDVIRVFRLYRVGAVKTKNGYDGLSTAYPLINANGNIVDVRIIPYSEDGHRVKGIKYEASFLQTMKKKKEERAEWPLFGEHLIMNGNQCQSLIKDSRKVFIVESEKTALICSIVKPDYIWLATTGLQNLTAARLQAVKDRLIYVYPDKDGIDEWRKKVNSLQAEGFKIILCSDYIKRNAKGDKDDLGDIILRQKMMEQPHEPQPQGPATSPTTQPQKVAWANLLKKCPPLQRLSDGLQLQVVLG